MSEADTAVHTIALIGGTGPEGKGLATRFALAGHRVVIGSRDAARGDEIARELAEALGGRGAAEHLSGAENATAVAQADVVVVAVPYSGQRPTLEALRDLLAGKIVVVAVVPMYFERGARPIEVEAGSATEEAAAILSDSRVIGAFHNLAAEVLMDPDAPVEADVLVTGGDANAKEAVMRLAECIQGVRAIDAGPLRFSRFVEGITILIAGINGRYKSHASIRISGLDHERHD